MATLTCPQCLEYYEMQPIVLPCGYSICSKHIRDNEEFDCSFCQNIHIQTQEQRFPVNNMLMQMIVEFNKAIEKAREPNELFKKFNTDIECDMLNIENNLKDQIKKHRKIILNECEKAFDQGYQKLINEFKSKLSAYIQYIHSSDEIKQIKNGIADIINTLKTYEYPGKQKLSEISDKSSEILRKIEEISEILKLKCQFLPKQFQFKPIDIGSCYIFDFNNKDLSWYVNSSSGLHFSSSLLSAYKKNDDQIIATSINEVGNSSGIDYIDKMSSEAESSEYSDWAIDNGRETSKPLNATKSRRTNSKFKQTKSNRPCEKIKESDKKISGLVYSMTLDSLKNQSLSSPKLPSKRGRKPNRLKYSASISSNKSKSLNKKSTKSSKAKLLEVTGSPQKLRPLLSWTLKRRKHPKTASKPQIEEKVLSNNKVDTKMSDCEQPKTHNSKECLKNSWQSSCIKLISDIIEDRDSLPFREPVNLDKYPDYFEQVDQMIDFGMILEKLKNGAYGDDNEDGLKKFDSDCILLFTNSKTYNTNKRSSIYGMTLRLQALYESRIKDIKNQRKKDINYTKPRYGRNIKTKYSKIFTSENKSDDFKNELNSKKLKMSISSQFNDNSQSPSSKNKQTGCQKSDFNLNFGLARFHRSTSIITTSTQESLSISDESEQAIKIEECE